MIVVPTTPAQISAVLEAARQNNIEIRFHCLEVKTQLGINDVRLILIRAA
jgi:hypothetical protein